MANYGYHLDAGKFATLLKDHCTKVLGVRHVLAAGRWCVRDGELLRRGRFEGPLPATDS